MATTKEVYVEELGKIVKVTEFDHSAQEIDDAVARVKGGPSALGAAPGGKGYGDTPIGIHAAAADESAATYAARIDAVMATMANGTAMQVVATPPELFWYGSHICTLYKANSDNACLMSNGAYIAWQFRVQKKYGAWQPLEHINPPMELGVEYRTTERYSGKPVYAKLVNFGSLPGENATATVAHGIENMRWIVSVDAMRHDTTDTDVTIPFPAGDPAGLTVCYADPTNIYIRSMSNVGYAHRQAYVIIKYTKMTD